MEWILMSQGMDQGKQISQVHWTESSVNTIQTCLGFPRACSCFISQVKHLLCFIRPHFLIHCPISLLWIHCCGNVSINGLKANNLGNNTNICTIVCLISHIISFRTYYMIYAGFEKWHSCERELKKLVYLDDISKHRNDLDVGILQSTLIFY